MDRDIKDKDRSIMHGLHVATLVGKIYKYMYNIIWIYVFIYVYNCKLYWKMKNVPSKVAIPNY